MKNLLMILSAALVFYGCATHHRLYSGPELDKKELSILKHESEGISGVGKFRISIIKIDSQKSTALSGSFNGVGDSVAIDLSPGSHAVTLTVSDGKRYRHVNLAINMKPGFTYTIKRNADEISADKPVVVTEEPTAE